MTLKLNIGDNFQNLKVTRTSDKYCFFGKKRMAWSTIEKYINNGEKIKFKVSPNKIINWCDKHDVIDYYNSFNEWNTYISNYSINKVHYTGILEIKDGLIFVDNEYYLPSPISNFDKDGNYHWNCKNLEIIDGLYNISLLRVKNDWYQSNEDSVELNLFKIDSNILNKKITDLKVNTNELWASQYDYPITFDYTSSFMNGAEFYLRKLNLLEVFRKFYIKERWSSNIKIVLTDNEIMEVMKPISENLYKILNDAFSNRNFNVDIDQSYGDYCVSNMMQFDDSVAKRFFNVIENQLQSM
jgi:hypothetical protein